jgi:hypothetical protein
MGVFPEMGLREQMVFSQQEGGQVHSRQWEQHVQKHTVLKEPSIFEDKPIVWHV